MEGKPGIHVTEKYVKVLSVLPTWHYLQTTQTKFFLRKFQSTHLTFCTIMVTLKGQSHLPFIGPQSLNGAPQYWAPSDWFQANPSSRQYVCKKLWFDALLLSMLSRNWRTATFAGGVARAKASKFSSSLSASLASVYARFLKLSILSLVYFGFLLLPLSLAMSSLSFCAASTAISEAS